MHLQSITDTVSIGETVMFRISKSGMPVLGTVTGKGFKGMQHCLIVSYAGQNYSVTDII